MGSSRTSVIVLAALGILVVLFALGRVLSEWEWWTFLLVVAGIAFAVALVLFVLRTVLHRTA